MVWGDFRVVSCFFWGGFVFLGVVFFEGGWVWGFLGWFLSFFGGSLGGFGVFSARVQPPKKESGGQGVGTGLLVPCSYWEWRSHTGSSAAHTGRPLGAMLGTYWCVLVHTGSYWCTLIPYWFRTSFYWSILG